MQFDIKKDWDKLAITLLAVTTALDYGNTLLAHKYQMWALSLLILYAIWMKK